jgi:hypothetical protein
MITKKDLIVAVLCTFSLTAAILSLLPVGSQGEWDPWIDAREDGTINVLDLIKVAGALGTSGDTTKNVRIAEYATYEWTGQKTVYYDDWWIIRNVTTGFKQVSITVSIDYNWHVYAYVGFIINGSAGEIMSIADTLTLWDAYKVSQTYTVTGSTMYINIWNMDATPNIAVKVGVYMTT